MSVVLTTNPFSFNPEPTDIILPDKVIEEDVMFLASKVATLGHIVPSPGVITGVYTGNSLSSSTVTISLLVRLKPFILFIRYLLSPIII